MSLVASYLITNLTTDPVAVVTVDRVTLGQGQTANISYRSPEVEAAVTQGLISIAKIGSDATVIQNLNDYINSLKGLAPQVVAL